MMKICCQLAVVLASSVSATLYTAPPDDGSRFDYIIIGGGTAGLVMANRLSADPKTTVAVIEAGSDQRDNKNVTNVYRFGLGLGTAIDWNYLSTPQQYAGNASGPGVPQTYHQGKGLGGTSLINGMTYIRSSKPQIDAWESSYGNKGWNWDSLLKCYRKSEHFQPPNQLQTQSGAQYDPAVNGMDGPLYVGWQQNISIPATYHAVQKSWNSVGFPQIPDVNAGNPSDFSLWPLTLNTAQDVRWDSARAYLYPIATRPNLSIFQNTIAKKLTWKDAKSGSNIAADGLEIIAASGPNKARTIHAAKEVVLSAGSLRSPVLLEASGVGNPSVLKQNNIPVKLALPSVGENLQDQPLNTLQSGLKTNSTGYPTFVTYPRARELFGADTDSVEADIRAKIPEYAAMIANATSPGGTTAAIQQQLLKVLTDLIFQTATPAAEILSAPLGASMTSPFWNMLPYARGSVHSDKAGAPVVNPNFFEIDADDKFQAAAGRLVRKFHDQGRSDGWLTAESAPGLATVPKDASDAQWNAFEKASYSPNSHPVGTCAMLSRELGGVVDPALKVYGTANVRVVDASVLPTQTVGHLTSTIYAVAERAAALMLGKAGC